jgi:hypothetical protein
LIQIWLIILNRIQYFKFAKLLLLFQQFFFFIFLNYFFAIIFLSLTYISFFEGHFIFFGLISGFQITLIFDITFLIQYINWLPFRKYICFENAFLIFFNVYILFFNNFIYFRIEVRLCQLLFIVTHWNQLFIAIIWLCITLQLIDVSLKTSPFFFLRISASIWFLELIA